MKFGTFFLCVGVLSLPVYSANAQPATDDAEGAVLVRGELSTQDEKDARTGGQRKLHLMELKSGQMVRFEASTGKNSFRPHIQIEDEQGKVLERATAEAGQNKAVVTFAPPVDGKYRIVVASGADVPTGVYALSISKVAGEPTVEFTGVLANTDAFDNVRQGCRQKVYTHRMLAGRSYTIDLEGQFDTYLRIENSAGANLAQDDDGGNGLNSRLEFRPAQNDTFRVIVTSCGQGAVGPFKLRIQSNHGEKLVFSTQSQLTQQDALDKVRQGSRCKIFAVKMEAGKSYIIDQQSAQFDSYLRLEDPAGNNLAQDDDGGGNLNSRITYRPTQTGLYRVIATSLGAGSTGDFSVTVRQN